jgi:hypothetical protein
LDRRLVFPGGGILPQGFRLTKYKGLGCKVKNGPKVKPLSESAIQPDETNSKAHLSLALYYLHATGVDGGSAEKSMQILREIDDWVDPLFEDYGQ